MITKSVDLNDREFGNYTFPRYRYHIKNLATYRKPSVGVLYAKAFQMIKYIDK